MTNSGQGCRFLESVLINVTEFDTEIEVDIYAQSDASMVLWTSWRRPSKREGELIDIQVIENDTNTVTSVPDNIRANYNSSRNNRHRIRITG